MKRSNVIILISCLIVVILGVIAAWQSNFWQVSHLLSDDAYYYFQLARNAAGGLGTSLDGLNHTNGFHALWMVILIGIYKIFPDYLAISIALSISALIGGLVIYIIGWLLKRFSVSDGWLAICLGLLVFNPWLTLQWVNGLETSIATLGLVIFWFYIVKIWQKKDLTIKSLIIVSALGSVAALGRTDAAIIAAPVLIWLWWQSSRHSGIGRWLVNAGVMIATVLIIQAPWIIWNYQNFGTLMQSSGQSFSYTNHQLLLIPQGHSLIIYIKGIILGSWNAVKIAWQTFVSPLVYLIALAYIILIRLKLKAVVPRLPMVSLISCLGLGIVLHAAVHGTIRWAVRPWYFVPLIIFIVLIIGYLSSGLPKIIFNKLVRYGLVAVSILSLLIGIPKVLAEYQNQASMYQVAQWINQHVAINEKVGSFNSGIYAYFSNRTIINLDGLVNNQAAWALQHQQLWDFTKQAQLNYLIDFDRYITYRYAWSWGEPNWQKKLGEPQVLIDGIKGKILLYKFSQL